MTSPPPYLKVSIRHCFVFLALVSNWQESLNLTKMKTSLMKFSILLSRLRFFNFFQFVTKMPNIFHVWQDTLSDIDVLIGPIVTVLFVFYRVTGIELNCFTRGHTTIGISGNQNCDGTNYKNIDKKNNNSVLASYFLLHFCGGRYKLLFLFFLNLKTAQFSSRKIWHTERNGIIAMKFERAWMHLLIVVFVA